MHTVLPTTFLEIPSLHCLNPLVLESYIYTRTHTHTSKHTHTPKRTLTYIQTNINTHTPDPLSNHPQRRHPSTFKEENKEEEGHALVAAQLVKVPEGLRSLAEEVQKLTVHRTRLAVPGWLGEPTRLEDPSPAKTVKIRAGDSNTKQDQPAPSSKQGAPSRVQPAAQGQTLKKVQTGSWRARTGGMGPRLAAHGPRSAY